MGLFQFRETDQAQVALSRTLPGRGMEMGPAAGRLVSFFGEL